MQQYHNNYDYCKMRKFSPLNKNERGLHTANEQLVKMKLNISANENLSNVIALIS